MQNLVDFHRALPENYEFKKVAQRKNNYILQFYYEYMVEKYESFLVENSDIWTVNFKQELQSIGLGHMCGTFIKQFRGEQMTHKNNSCKQSCRIMHFILTPY